MNDCTATSRFWFSLIAMALVAACAAPISVVAASL